jgi:ferritin-like metal-binding protein YciE
VLQGNVHEPQGHKALANVSRMNANRTTGKIYNSKEDSMMEITSLKDLYVTELQELMSMETQLGPTLKRLEAAAVHPSLKEAFGEHQKETLKQGERVGMLLQKHGASPVHTDQAMQALIGETNKMMSMLADDNLRDASLIASAQKLEHYEIAAYGSAAAFAGQLGLREDQDTLHAILDEERLSDTLLTGLAKSEVNQDALAA